MTNDLKSSTIADLDESLDGRVIRPGQPGYDDARQVFYGGHDLRPAIVVRAASDDDVARTIGLARETGLELAVRSGGHSGAGHGSTDGGIQLDLADMNGLEIDVARTDRVGRVRDSPPRSTRWRPALTVSRPGSGTPARSASAGSRWEAASGSSFASTA